MTGTQWLLQLEGRRKAHSRSPGTFVPIILSSKGTGTRRFHSTSFWGPGSRYGGSAQPHGATHRGGFNSARNGSQGRGGFDSATTVHGSRSHSLHRRETRNAEDSCRTHSQHPNSRQDGQSTINSEFGGREERCPQKEATNNSLAQQGGHPMEEPMEVDAPKLLESQDTELAGTVETRDPDETIVKEPTRPKPESQKRKSYPWNRV